MLLNLRFNSDDDQRHDWRVPRLIQGRHHLCWRSLRLLRWRRRVELAMLDRTAHPHWSAMGE
jgi:hypothetical protein